MEPTCACRRWPTCSRIGCPLDPVRPPGRVTVGPITRFSVAAIVGLALILAAMDASCWLAGAYCQ